MKRVRNRNQDQPITFDELNLTSSLKIAVLGPHPDDFDAIAVTLKRLHSSGNPVFLSVLTSGASGVEDGFCEPPTRENKEAIREEEQLASIRLFGLDENCVTFQHLLEDKDGNPLDSAFNNAIIENYLNGLKPDLIFLPHANDSNLGHVRCCKMALKVVKKLGLNTVFFLNRDPKTTTMIAEVYTGFDDEKAAWKAELLRCHQSQQQRNLNTRNHGFDERILNFNRTTAADYRLPVPYAEIFEIIMMN